MQRVKRGQKIIVKVNFFLKEKSLNFLIQKIGREALRIRFVPKIEPGHSKHACSLTLDAGRITTPCTVFDG